MPPRECILATIEAIADYTNGLDFSSFSRDRRTVDAVVRNLIIIGEAASHIPAEVVSEHPEVLWRGPTCATWSCTSTSAWTNG